MTNMLHPEIQNQPEAQTLDCPECQTIIPINPGYVTWCDQCGWNLKPQTEENPSRFAKLYISIGEKHGKNLLEELLNTQLLAPKLTASKALAFLFAFIIHSLTFLFAILGIVLIIRGWPNFAAILGSLFCLSIAWVLSPRFPKSPKQVISREEFPTLYQIVDEIAASLETQAVDNIVILPQFNAAFSQVGWRRKKVLYLGLPLFLVLAGQERVALIAHELAHGVNDDPNRSLFVGSALKSLISWYEILYPTQLVASGQGIYALLNIPVTLFLLLVANTVWVGILILLHLIWRASQRAEYLADYLAAQISGSDSLRLVLTKLHLGEGTFRRTVQSVTLNEDNRNLFDVLKKRINNVPQRELERINRLMTLELSRMDTTHPPTAYRIKFLQAHAVSKPKYVLSKEDMVQMDSELEPLQKEVQSKLKNMYRRSLYY